MQRGRERGRHLVSARDAGVSGSLVCCKERCKEDAARCIDGHGGNGIPTAAIPQVLQGIRLHYPCAAHLQKPLCYHVMVHP